ncbi:MAG: Crp/Fnr family transcriptional regulator [Rhodospirillales bacterium]
MNEPQIEQSPAPDDDNEPLELEYRDYKSGQIIFEQGDIGTEAYFVDSGKVEIARGDGTAETVLAVVSKGELLGEMALVDAEERMATARAMGKTTLIVVPKRVFDRVLRKSNPIVVAMMKTLLRRLRYEGGATVKKTLG